MMDMPKILVVGSFVKDLIVSTPRFPNAGETVLGNSFQTASGGKGANQAIQAARLGAHVTMVGKVGDDVYGREMISSCLECGIDCSRVMMDDKAPSSIGNVQLQIGQDGKTQNRIIVVPGANMAIQKEDIRFLETEIANYDMVLLQLEIPMEINELVAEYAYQKNVPVMLNSAPSAQISDCLISKLTYISPNEYEAADLTGIRIHRNGQNVNEKDVKAVIHSLIERGAQNVLITLGSMGAAFGNKKEFYLCPAVKNVSAVDPTGAGDSFVGAFCTLVSMGIDYERAVSIANYVGALTVSHMGAQPSLPSLEQVKALIHERDDDVLLGLQKAAV